MRQWFAAVLVVACWAAWLGVGCQETASEQYGETFDWYDLGGGHHLAQVRFAFELDGLATAGVFPRAWQRIAASNGGLRELRVTLSRGHWDDELFGRQPVAVWPTGVLLWARFDDDDDDDDDEPAALERLVHSMSGLFCVSLQQLTDQHLTVSTPHLSSLSDQPASSGRYFLGALPREPVCTENLSPLLALLPCRDAAGLAQLLQPRALFSSRHHSISIEHRRTADRLSLRVTVSAVVSSAGRSAATVGQLLQRRSVAHCTLANYTRLRYNGVDSDAEQTLGGVAGQQRGQWSAASASSGGWVQVVRRATGHGDERGGVLIQMTAVDGDQAVPVSYLEPLPHFLRYYVSQLRVLDGAAQLHDVAFALPDDRRQSGWLHVSALLQPGQPLVVHLPFDKVFRAWTDFPPDAHLGELIPAGLLTTGPGQHVFTTATLVMLPTPDFSMPYNTIMISGTVISLFFGSLFNRLVKHHYYLRDGSADPAQRPLARLLSFIHSKLR